MAILDVALLLEPLSDEEPAGPNLEYDADFMSFEAAAKPKAEQQYGSTIIPAEDPNWSEVRRLGMDLATRTKDLRVGCVLAQCLLVTDGLAAFAESLALVRGYLERYWQSVHPRLDPDDDLDPTLRVNTVAWLSDQSTTVGSLRSVPIVFSRLWGRFTLRDFAIAMGEIPPPADEEPPQLSSIEAAFAECELEQLQNDTVAIRESIDHVEAIENTITEQVGAARALSLDNLRFALRELHAILEKHLSARQGAMGDDLVADQGLTDADGAPAPRLTGEIRSREDAILALDKICDYYTRNEPSSPIPLLLGRARRLASKNFLEIIKDLTPDVVSQIRALGGVDNDTPSE